MVYNSVNYNSLHFSIEVLIKHTLHNRLLLEVMEIMMQTLLFKIVNLQWFAFLYFLVYRVVHLLTFCVYDTVENDSQDVHASTFEFIHHKFHNTSRNLFNN